MELDKGNNNLRNLYQIDSILNTEQQVNSGMEGYVEVAKTYEGGETDNIIVSVDNTKNIITATVKPIQFATRDEFPETGSDRLLYISTSDNITWRWDNELSDYVMVGKDYSVEIAEMKDNIQNNTNEIQRLDQEITDIQAKDVEQDLLLTAIEEANKDRDIKINALETKSAEHEQDLAANEKAIQANSDEIAKNTAAIEQNTKDIGSNKAAILTLTDGSGNSIEISVDPLTYILTVNLKNKAGTTISTSTVDLPLETMVVSASYKDGTLTLTLQNGQTLDIDISSIVDGLVNKQTFDNEITRLDSEITTLQGEVTAHDLTLTSIEEANKDRDTKINALETKINEHEQELADYENRIADAETGLSNIDITVDDDLRLHYTDFNGDTHDYTTGYLPDDDTIVVKSSGTDGNYINLNNTLANVRILTKVPYGIQILTVSNPDGSGEQTYISETSGSSLATRINWQPYTPTGDAFSSGAVIRSVTLWSKTSDSVNTLVNALSLSYPTTITDSHQQARVVNDISELKTFINESEDVLEYTFELKSGVVLSKLSLNKIYVTSPLAGNGTQSSPLSITNDSAHRFVTDTQISQWNNKQNKLIAGTNITIDEDGKTINAIVPDGGKIDSISVNGQPQTIDENKNVDISVPESLSELSDDETHRLVTDNEKAEWSGKQDKLTAGENITISDDGTISASGGLSNETDPTVPNHVKEITEQNITDWNNKLDTEKSNDSKTIYSQVKYMSGMSGDDIMAAITTFNEPNVNIFGGYQPTENTTGSVFAVTVDGIQAMILDMPSMKSTQFQLLPSEIDMSVMSSKLYMGDNSIKLTFGQDMQGITISKEKSTYNGEEIATVEGSNKLYIPKTDIKTLNSASDSGYSDPTERQKVISVEALSWWNGAWSDTNDSNLKYFVGGEIAGKSDIPRPLWLADSITLNDAGIEADYTIPKKNISPLVATGYTIQASDKIMFATEKATYLGVVKSTSDDNVTATPKFDMATVGLVEQNAFDGQYSSLSGTPTLGSLASKSIVTKVDLDDEIQGSLDKADTAIQPSALDNYIPTSQRGANEGIATLDASGKVPISQLPSYVDDVQEFATKNDFPETGEDGKIYIAKDTNITYRWGGTEYTEISKSLALGETPNTAYAGDKGKANADAIGRLKTSVADIESKNASQDTAITKAQDTADGAVSKNEEQDTAILKAQTTAESKYTKPEGGIPASDLAGDIPKSKITGLDSIVTADDLDNIINNTTKIANGNGGFAAGGDASILGVGGGGAIGQGAKTREGGAIGFLAYSASGGAIGQGASAGLGFSGGYDAKVKNNGNTVSPSYIDAIQLGTGTNNNEKTLQVYDYQLMDSGGDVPHERLKYAYDKGQLYITVINTSPSVKYGGTWYKLKGEYVLQVVSSGVNVNFDADLNGNGFESGNIIEAGLPNITGTIHQNSSDKGDNFLSDCGTDKIQVNGALYMADPVDRSGMSNSGTYSAYTTIGIDASRSNGIYGNSSTVQPRAFKVYVWVKISD